MKSLSYIRPLVAAATLALLIPSLQAENNPPPIITSLTFKKAYLFQVAEQLLKEADANIVLSAEVREMYVPEITLRDVTAEGVLQALAAVMPEIRVQTSGNDRDGLIFNVTLNKPAPIPSNQVCRVFKANTKDRLQGKELETLMQNLTDAATLACEVKTQRMGSGDMPVIKAHAPTGILIVAGKESDVELVGQVILALGGEAVPSTEPTLLSLSPSLGSRWKFESSSPEYHQLMQQFEDVRRKLEQSLFSSELEKQVDVLRRLGEVKSATPGEPKTPPAPSPADAPAVKP